MDFQEYWSRPTIKQQFIPWIDNFFREYPNVAMIFLSSNNELYLIRGVEDNQVALKHGRQGFVIESPIWDHREVEELGI